MTVLTSPLHPAWAAAGLTFLVLLTTARVRSTPGDLLLLLSPPLPDDPADHTAEAGGPSPA